MPLEKLTSSWSIKAKLDMVNSVSTVGGEFYYFIKPNILGRGLNGKNKRYLILFHFGPKKGATLFSVTLVLLTSTSGPEEKISTISSAFASKKV